jgi:O-antigen ligase
MRLHIVAVLYALWILGIFVVFYLVKGQNENALQLAVMCGAIPAACQVLLIGVDWRGLVAPVKLWLALLLVVLLSYLGNAIDPRTAPSGTEGLSVPDAWVPLIYTINLIFILGIATLVAGCPDRRLLRFIAGFYGIFASPFLFYIDLTGEVQWGRLTAGLQPITWGLMGLTVCLAAFARSPGVLAVVTFAVGLFTMLEASSRESILAIAATLIVITPLYFHGMGSLRRLGTLAGSCAILIAALVLLDSYVSSAFHYVSYDVFLLNSRNRGAGSGFSGRSGLWEEAFNLWLRSPVLGLGFRQHERFMELPAHNSYLAMLADTGLGGFIWYVVLLVWSLVAAWGIEEQKTRRFAVAMIAAYIVNGFFDRRAINTGNPFGVFFVLCCSVALVDQSLRKAADLCGKGMRAVSLGTGRRIGFDAR